jgi:hypothetical protein
MTRFIAFLPIVLCLGCSGTTDNGEDSGIVIDGLIPLEGGYATTSAVSDNSCGDHAVLEESFTSSVSAASLESYGLMFEFIEENLQFDCALVMYSFDCSASVTEDYADWGWAAVAGFSHSFNGTWPTDSSFSGSVTTEVTCAGSECDGLAGVLEITFPCTTTHSIDAAQE